MSHLSPLAKQIRTPVGAPPVLRQPWGFLVHTTGRGIVDSAKRKGKRPIDIALDIYARSQDGRLHPYKWGGPTYVMDHGGELYQLAPDDVLTFHAGGPSRAAYMSGAWAERAAPKAYEHWRKQWPGYKSPQHLYPTRSANEAYVGLETIPCGAGFGMPMRPGLLFTQAQHDRIVELGRDLAVRHAWPSDWARTPRLVGHEDVQLLDRQNAGGGWDPGHLRDAPYFDFGYVRACLERDA